MAKKAKHIYDAAEARRLQGIALPPKLKCARCERWYGQPNFSFRMLNDARSAIMNRGRNAEYKIHCARCAGKQLVEIECVDCGVIKGCDDFSKVQRAQPDNAKCFACVDKQVEVEPVNDDVYHDPRKAFVPLEGDSSYPVDVWSVNQNASRASVSGYNGGEDDDDGGVSVTQGFSQMSFTPNYTNSLIDTEDRANSTASPGGWEVAGQSRNKTSTARSTSAFNSNVAERSDYTVKNGWAKIKAYKPPPPPVKAPAVQEPDDDWKSESEEEDNDDDDDDDDDADI